MVRKVKNKKPGISILVTILLMAVITVFVYQSIITLGNQHIFENEYDNKTSSYSSLKTTPDSSDDRTTSVPPSKIEPAPSVPLSPDKLNSPNAFLIRLKDHNILMQKNSEEKIYPASLLK